MTKAEYENYIRQGLRMASIRWPVRGQVLRAATREYTGPIPRRKVERQCAACQNWFFSEDVQVDHIQECGSLVDDPGGFIARMFCEADNMQVLCKGCHQAKTRASRLARKLKRETGNTIH